MPFYTLMNARVVTKRTAVRGGGESRAYSDQNKQPQAPTFMYGVRLFVFFRTNVPKILELVWGF